jgi:hypothetical protein
MHGGQVGKKEGQAVLQARDMLEESKSLGQIWGSADRIRRGEATWPLRVLLRLWGLCTNSSKDRSGLQSEILL